MNIDPSYFDVVTDEHDKCVMTNGSLLLCNKTNNEIIAVPLCPNVVATFGLEELQDPQINILKQTSFCDAHLSSVEKEDKNLQDEDFNSKDNLGKMWTSENTFAFINTVSEHYNEFSISLKKKVWEKIAKKLSQSINREFTAVACETKWKTLKRTYKSISISNQTSGQKKRFWEFFNAMHSVLFNKPEINPVATCSSLEGFHTKVGNENMCPNELNTSSEPSTSSAPSTADQSSRSAIFESSFSKKRKQKQTESERRHKEKMVRLDRFNDIFAQMVEKLPNKGNEN